MVWTETGPRCKPEFLYNTIIIIMDKTCYFLAPNEYYAFSVHVFRFQFQITPLTALLVKFNRKRVVENLFQTPCSLKYELNITQR